MDAAAADRPLLDAGVELGRWRLQRVERLSIVPDFRGPDGIWTKNPEMEERAFQAYSLFTKNPRKYWEQTLNSPPLLGDLSNIKPNPGHYALAKLGNMGILKCIITQNIDNLHERACSDKVYDYHGNAFKLRCVICGTRYGLEEYDLNALNEAGKLPPHCKSCSGIVKEDIVHFGEPIPSDVAEHSTSEAGLRNVRCRLSIC